MSASILVAYAFKYGSTQELAGVIETTLRQRDVIRISACSLPATFGLRERSLQ